jgi:hypothetical protein
MDKIFEEEALKIGLRINMGKGKTERFHINADPGIVLTTDGKPIPIVSEYKYLGANTLNQTANVATRIEQSWGICRSMHDVWTSGSTIAEKRKLFDTLVTPVLAYGGGMYNLDAKTITTINGAYSRMLRYCLGLPPAYISREEWTSEKTYKELPFLSSTIKARRVGLLTHCIRAQLEGRQHHPVVDVLEFYRALQTTPAKGTMRSILNDCHMLYPEELIDAASCRKKSAKLVADVLRWEQETIWTKKRKIIRKGTNTTKTTNSPKTDNQKIETIIKECKHKLIIRKKI